MALMTAQLDFGVGPAVTTDLYYPTDLPAEVGNVARGVVTLLPGGGRPSDSWYVMTAAARYAADNGLVFVLPRCAGHPALQNGQLPDLRPQLESFFVLPAAPLPYVIAGVFENGPVALQTALAQPERYTAAGCFGAAPLSESLLDGAKTAPPLLLCHAEPAGSSQGNQHHTFAKAARDKGHRCDVFSWAGENDWNMADRALTEFLGWLLDNGYGARKSADWADPARQRRFAGDSERKAPCV